MALAFLTEFGIAFASKDGHSWGYEKTVYGPGDWGRKAPFCNGQYQSPINIVTNYAQVNSSQKSLELAFDNSDATITGTLINNGHAPTVLVNKSAGGVTLKGGPLGQRLFVLEQFHFHYGCENNFGSEHTMDAKSFASEMHLVFYNSLYSGFNEAASKPDGLAVIGVFIQVDGKFNRWMEIIAVLFRNVHHPHGDSYNLGNGLPLAKLVPDFGIKNFPYYAYKGSLTTPPCYESVQWILIANPVSVTESELVMMRSLTSNNGKSLCNNFRPVKPLNGRQITKGPGQGKLAEFLQVHLFR